MKNRNFKWAVLSVCASLVMLLIVNTQYKIRAVELPDQKISTLNVPIEIQTKKDKNGKTQLIVRTPAPALEDDCDDCRKRAGRQKVFPGVEKTAILEQIRPTDPSQCRSIDCVENPEECARALGIKKEAL